MLSRDHLDTAAVQEATANAHERVCKDICVVLSVVHVALQWYIGHAIKRLGLLSYQARFLHR